jgi:hypothetical protein
MAHQNDLRLMENLRNEAVRVSLDVEYNESSYQVGGWHLLPNIDQISSSRFLCSTVPDVERLRQFAVPVACFEELFAADDMHGAGLRL